MFPMRDHLYELAKLRENELMEMARQQQQLKEARIYTYESWTLDPLRNLWRKMLGRTNGKRSTATRARVGQIKAYGR